MRRHELVINAKSPEILEYTLPKKEGAWWYVDITFKGGQKTKKKFSSEIEAKAWLDNRE